MSILKSKKNNYFLFILFIITFYFQLYIYLKNIYVNIKCEGNNIEIKYFKIFKKNYTYNNIYI